MSTKHNGVAIASRILVIITCGVLLRVPQEVAFAQSQERGRVPLFMAERFVSGQNVASIFEGWEPNLDGTFSLYFGYMNRNWEEELDIPVGPENFFEPGPQDRGQPTHFVPRRAKNVFRVIVPKDFGDKKLIVWTLSVRGKTEQVPGSLRREYQVDVSRDRESGNTPPVIKPVPDQAITLPATASLTVEVSDDGLPKIDETTRQRRREPPAAGPPFKEPPRRGLSVYWRKYRGPGDVTFAPAAPQNVADGKATTTVTFKSPGDYVLQVVADDGSGSGGVVSHCCWSTSQIKVAVRGAP